MNVHHLSLPHAPNARPATPAPAPASDQLELGSEQLLKGRREILIRHGDKLYRLRHTSNDKLILTK
jgi:hemin uptake protein HemP